jgi:hypothetical protein
MGKIKDTEFQHVVLTGAALWTLLGLLKIAPDPENIAVAAVYAALILIYVRKPLIGARIIAKLTIALALVLVAISGLFDSQTGPMRWRMLITEIVTVAASVVASRKLMAESSERLQGAVLAGLTYLTSLVVIMNVLEPIWPPLVTAAYAIFAAVLLVASRRRGGERLLRQMGGVTIVIVVARLLLVDMASVETIWRVLLFLVCGAVFLYAGYRLQPTKSAAASK